MWRKFKYIILVTASWEGPQWSYSKSEITNEIFSFLLSTFQKNDLHCYYVHDIDCDINCEMHGPKVKGSGTRLGPYEDNISRLSFVLSQKCEINWMHVMILTKSSTEIVKFMALWIRDSGLRVGRIRLYYQYILNFRKFIFTYTK